MSERARRSPGADHRSQSGTWAGDRACVPDQRCERLHLRPGRGHARACASRAERRCAGRARKWPPRRPTWLTRTRSSRSSTPPPSASPSSRSWSTTPACTAPRARSGRSTGVSGWGRSRSTYSARCSPRGRSSPSSGAIGQGKIIQLSGGGATSPLPGLSAYAASKAAIVRFVETLALELREDQRRRQRDRAGRAQHPAPGRGDRRRPGQGRRARSTSARSSSSAAAARRSSEAPSSRSGWPRPIATESPASCSARCGTRGASCPLTAKTSTPMSTRCAVSFPPTAASAGAVDSGGADCEVAVQVWLSSGRCWQPARDRAPFCHAPLHRWWLCLPANR